MAVVVLYEGKFVWLKQSYFSANENTEKFNVWALLYGKNGGSTKRNNSAVFSVFKSNKPRIFIKEHDTCVIRQMVQWYSNDFGKNEKRGVLPKLFLCLFVNSDPVSRTVPFVVPRDRKTAFPFKRIALCRLFSVYWTRRSCNPSNVPAVSSYFLEQGIQVCCISRQCDIKLYPTARARLGERLWCPADGVDKGNVT